MTKILPMLLTLVLGIQMASAHCEIPCGIYDDPQRIAIMREHVATIEKSMREIIVLEKTTENTNQIVRWVSNKELYASKLQGVTSQYFMTQRIKPGQEMYEEKLMLLHKILLLSMKAKQTTDVLVVDDLRKTITLFEEMYLGDNHIHRDKRHK